MFHFVIKLGIVSYVCVALYPKEKTNLHGEMFAFQYRMLYSLEVAKFLKSLIIQIAI